MSYGDSEPVTKQNLSRPTTGNWRFIRLSHNRRYLQWGNFESRTEESPGLDDLKEQSRTLKHSMKNKLTSAVDLSIVSSVVSNVSASPPASPLSEETITSVTGKGATAGDKTATERQQQQQKQQHHRSNTSTKITIHGIVAGGSSRGHVSPTPGSPSVPEMGSSVGGSSSGGGAAGKEKVLLQLHPSSHVIASEWLDGLLMLLNQKPITAETTKLVNLITSYGLKIRLLNIRYEDLNSDEPRVPTREELDDDYWYDFGGMEAGA
jgi:engulfment and cell motility protein 1